MRPLVRDVRSKKWEITMLHLHQRLLSPSRFPKVERKPSEYRIERGSIGQRILKEDDRAEPVSDLVFQRLDSVVDEVVNNVAVGTVHTIDEARAVLQSIEEVVTSTNFVCSIPYYLIHSFSEGLLPRDLDSQLVYAAENDLRRSHILANEDEDFSHVDCDLSSLLYLCVGEALQIPLCMVEVPQHNFIRWRLSDTQHLNWDTNYGFNKFTDSGYAARYGVNPEHIVNGTYLADLSVANVEGYFSFVRGITFQRAQNYADSITEYRSAVNNYPQSPSSRNNIAWLFVSVREAQQIVTSDEALQLAQQACGIDRSHSYLDTLACVYAERGDFASAIQFETEAYDLYPSPGYQEMIEAFRDGKTWLDVHGSP